MIRWLFCFFCAGIMYSQDDGLPPNFIYLEPIEDFIARESISLEVIVTDRNKINKVSIFYRFNDNLEFVQAEMFESSQPVIYDVEIPLDEVEPGFIQYYFYAKDEFGNQSTWPDGGEDLPVVLPVYRASKTAINGVIGNITSNKLLKLNPVRYIPRSKNKKPITTHTVIKFVKSIDFNFMFLELSSEIALSEYGLIDQIKIPNKAAKKPKK